MIGPGIALLLLTHVAVVWLLVGLIWTVQVVHYPLFSSVGREHFIAYQHRHMRAITLVVGPAMAVEVATTLALLAFAPETVPAALPWLGAATLAVNWLATWLLAVPLHQRLVAGFDPQTHRSLVKANALRTAMWSLHGLISLAMLLAVLTS